MKAGTPTNRDDGSETGHNPWSYCGRLRGNQSGVGPLALIDLFAGCGGLSLGLECAGFSPILFSEISASAAATYLANRPEGVVEHVSDVRNLTSEKLKRLRGEWGARQILDVDLLTGGPPCQGFSGIGHRRTFGHIQKKDVPSNHLFREMVRIIKAIKPRIFLFENVRGILNSRWSEAGQRGEVFRDVLASFVGISNYTVRWQLVLASQYGVPQKRPRVMIVGFRDDVIAGMKRKPGVGSRPTMERGTAVEDGFLPPPCGTAPNLEDLLSDIEDPDFRNILRTNAYPCDPKNEVQRRLRTRPDGQTLLKGDVLTEHEYSKHSQRVKTKFEYMIENDGRVHPEHRTKKFAQRVLPRVWSETGPSITTCSLPDDYVHYSQPRSLTVREWARLQTFPDWYEFRGPRTTGGRRRAGDPEAGVWDREVPKYTQIGNAVPVELARVVGEHFIRVLGAEPSKSRGRIP